jgi:hypothetical protein
MTKKMIVRRLGIVSALLCATVAAIGIGAGTAGAAPNPTYPGCLWKNVKGDPLWVRQYPDKNTAILGSITQTNLFWATKYNAYNQGAHWVELSAGGWVNADYIAYNSGNKGYTQSYCYGQG